jgi:hypothetical protein
MLSKIIRQNALLPSFLPVNLPLLSQFHRLTGESDHLIVGSRIAGDSGNGLTYAKSRETGHENATAAMAGVANSYTQFTGTFAGQSVLVRTLIAAPQVSLVLRIDNLSRNSKIKAFDLDRTTDSKGLFPIT